MKNPTVLKYISDQPRALRDVLDRKKVFVDPFLEVLNKNRIKKILFFGSGTSYNVSTIAAHYFKHIVGIDSSGNYPTVFKNYEKADWTGLLNKDEILFVGISQSGTSRSTIDVMKDAKSKGYKTIALTENLESEITKHVDTVIHLLCGKELTPPETRGYTVSVITMLIWAIEASKLYGKMDEDELEKFYNEIRYLADNYEKVLEESRDWYNRNATTIVNSDRIYVLGYGVDYGSMLEGMLKVGEMLRLPTIGYELEEYVHGPTMAISPRQTIIIIGSDETEFERADMFREVFKKYTPRVHMLTCNAINKDSRDLEFSIKVNKYIAPLVYTVPFQYISAQGALDINIDTNIDPFDESLGHLSDEEK